VCFTSGMTRFPRFTATRSNTTTEVGCAYVGGGFHLEVVIRNAPAVASPLRFDCLFAYLTGRTTA
jgi:hypothetical protein